ncbi:hypothetical protein Pfo_004508 [Paulownia fortunei]|nr:hypothetical protein Pfo_004508 [Paulownia fortunei]
MRVQKLLSSFNICEEDKTRPKDSNYKISQKINNADRKAAASQLFLSTLNSHTMVTELPQPRTLSSSSSNCCILSEWIFCPNFRKEKLCWVINQNFIFILRSNCSNSIS